MYPVRGRRGAMHVGLAIESKSYPLAYFWTRAASQILAVLAQRDLPVDWQEHFVAYQAY